MHLQRVQQQQFNNRNCAYKLVECNIFSRMYNNPLNITNLETILHNNSFNRNLFCIRYNLHL